jgi:tetratricopeptide (TPR) repeat protein
LLFGAAAVWMAVATARPVMLEQRALRDAAVALRKGDMGGANNGLWAATKILPTDPRPIADSLRLTMEDAMAQAARGDAALGGAILNNALAELRIPATLGDDLTLRRVQAQVLEEIGRLLHREHRLREAADAWRGIVARAPSNINDRLHLADLLWELGDRAEARTAYREGLKLNRQSYLDPLRQLPEAQRKTVEARAGSG